MYDDALLITDAHHESLRYGPPRLCVNEGQVFLSFQVDNPTPWHITEYVQIYARLRQADGGVCERLIGWEGCSVAPGQQRPMHFYAEALSGQAASEASGALSGLLEVQIRSLSQLRSRLICRGHVERL